MFGTLIAWLVECNAKVLPVTYECVKIERVEFTDSRYKNIKFTEHMWIATIVKKQGDDSSEFELFNSMDDPRVFDSSWKLGNGLSIYDAYEYDEYKKLKASIAAKFKADDNLLVQITSCVLINDALKARDARAK